MYLTNLWRTHHPYPEKFYTVKVFADILSELKLTEIPRTHPVALYSYVRASDKKKKKNLENRRMSI